MQDFSPELLAAREQHLQDLIAAPFWNPPFRKPTFDPKPPAVHPLVSPTYPISPNAAAAVVERYRMAWEDALAEKEAALAEAASLKRSPGDGYWKREHRARALYATSLALLEALIQ